MDQSIKMKREAILDFKAQILDLRKALKSYQDSLTLERLEKENMEWTLLHEKFQMERA